MNLRGEKLLSNKVSALKKGDCPYTLFLGAGASKSSGVPLTGQLVFKWKTQVYEDLCRTDPKYREIAFEDWNVNCLDDQKTLQVEELKLDYPNYKTWRKYNNPYGEDSDYSLLFSTLYQTPKERQLFIEDLIDDKKPAFGYLFLSGLISDERFNRILTTNFDDLLNDALFKWYDQKPITCAFDSMVSGIRVDSKRPKIIKLHGDFLYDNLKNIRNELRSLDANIEQKLFEMCKDRGLIVVGYSGCDRSVMNPLNEMLRKSGYLEMGLHWCFTKGEANRIRKLNNGELSIDAAPNGLRELMELHRQYANKVFFYEIEDFDRLMETMFSDCKCEAPDILMNPKEVNPFKEFHKALFQQDGKRVVDLSEFQHDYYIKFCDAHIDKESLEDDIEITEESRFARGKRYSKLANKANKSQQRKDAVANAVRNYDKCIENLEAYVISSKAELNLKGDSLGSYIYALKRLSGVFISKSKDVSIISSEQTQMLELLDQSLSYVNEGLVLSDSLSETQQLQYRENLRSFALNGCCAVSRKCELLDEITTENHTLVFRLFEFDLKLYPDKSHAMQIIKDSDFGFLLKSLGTDISEKFNLHWD